MITQEDFELLQHKINYLNRYYHLFDSNEIILLKRLDDQSIEINDFTETNQYFDLNSANKRLFDIECCLHDLI